MNHHALVLALSIAMCTHIVLYALLNLWPAPSPDKKTSIPVTLVVSPDSTPSPASSEQLAASSNAQQRISTTAESVRKQSDASENQNASSTAHDGTQSEAKKRDLQQDTARRQQAASVRQIFSSTNKADVAISAITAEATETMSEYEQQLLAHLLAGELYDQFHQFMQSSGEQEVQFSISLVLFENGAIKSARLVEKNTSLNIDRLAITAAYNASPYPRPPSDDFKKGFSYKVSMTYKGNQLR